MKASRVYIYLLPNLLTTANLFCGFYAIVSALKGFYVEAAMTIIAAGFLDIFDGRVARLINAHSQFGKEYDSLADLISFGLAPSILIYLCALKPYGRIGWLVTFFFLACGALRLARFNIQSHTIEKNYFEGLPIPIAASALATTTVLFEELRLPEVRNIFILALTASLSYLMISSVRYRSFKDLDLRRKRSFGVLVGAVIFIIVVASHPQTTLFVVNLSYISYGLIHHILFHPTANRKGGRKQSTPFRVIEGSKQNQYGKD